MAILVGMCGILQGTVYKHMSIEIGLVHAVLIGNAMVLSMNVLVFVLVQKFPQHFPLFMQAKDTFDFKWWYLLPGCFGMIAVAGMPYAYYKIDTVRVTVTIIATQMLTSVMWDYWAESTPIDIKKSLGLLLSIGSVLLIFS